MRVGFIRKLMNVVRKQADISGGHCDPAFMLTEDYTAGQFALDYIIGNYNRRSQRQQKKGSTYTICKELDENRTKMRHKKRPPSD
jgi:hypothetical protein